MKKTFLLNALLVSLFFHSYFVFATEPPIQTTQTMNLRSNKYVNISMLSLALLLILRDPDTHYYFCKPPNTLNKMPIFCYSVQNKTCFSFSREETHCPTQWVHLIDYKDSHCINDPKKDKIDREFKYGLCKNSKSKYKKYVCPDPESPFKEPIACDLVDGYICSVKQPKGFIGSPQTYDRNKCSKDWISLKQHRKNIKAMNAKMNGSHSAHNNRFYSHNKKCGNRKIK